MISAQTTSNIFPFGFLVLVVAIVIFCRWLAMGAHKSAIRTEVTKLKSKLINIRWIPGGGDKNDTVYEVTLVLPSGKQVSAMCKCNVWHGVYWKSMPWLLRESAPKRDFAPAAKPMRVVADCSTCGYGLQDGWVACPNCGNEVAS